MPAARGRYGMHDLLRMYASELVATADSASERCAALTRLFDHYLYTAALAMDVTFPAESDRRPSITPPASPCPEFAGGPAAWAWLDTERPTLVAVVAHTAGHGWPDHAIRMADILFRYLETGGHHLETVAVLEHVRRAAHDMGGPPPAGTRGLPGDRRRGRDGTPEVRDVRTQLDSLL